MAITPIKALLFLAGGTAAAAATAYVSGALDPYLARPPATIASLPGPGPGEGDPKGNRLPGQEQSAEASAPAEVPAAGKPEEAAAVPETAAPAVVAPSFDVVRVESEGSIVIAGKATPNAKVEIVIGSNVIGETVAGADGDFAAVLDKPLKPGGYQIVLRSTAPGNVVAMSVETAIVSVPETKDGQVLALVEEPGKPAEMISVPKPEAKPAGEAPPAGEQAAAESPAVEAEAVPPAGEQAVGEPSAPTEPKAGEQVEALTPEPPPAEAPAAPLVAAAPPIKVEAVEIEGRNVFVAGAADAGRTVRGYANDILLGDAVASPEGRFLIEAERDLPVGDYIVRVDALDPDGVKVVARAAVPFEREPGEAVAAVAPPEPKAPPAPAEAPPAVAGAPAVDAPPAVAEAPATPKPAAPEAPAVVEAPSAETPPAEAGAPAAPGPETPPAVAEAPAAPSAPAETPPAVASGPDVEIAAAPPGSEPAPPAAGVPEVTAPKLQNVDSAVIIRRGDTLWRISRRVYGRGVRYSTIYLANQTQIEDPDRIWPGQVFKVPDKTSEGDAADMTGMGAQVTTMPQEPAAAAQ